MVYLKSVENVITLGKLIGLLFLFCLPLLSILFLKTKRNDLARPVMGTIFLVNFGSCVRRWSLLQGYLPVKFKDPKFMKLSCAFKLFKLFHDLFAIIFLLLKL